MCKLFLICPECFSEQLLVEKYGVNSYFLTSLGTIFDRDPDTYSVNIQYLLRSTPITDVFILQGLDCDFVNKTLNNEKNLIGIAAEEVYATSHQKIKRNKVVSISKSKRKLELVRNNLDKQIQFVRKVIGDATHESTSSYIIEGIIVNDSESLSSVEVYKRVNTKDDI